MSERHTIEWIDGGLEPRVPPNPNFPNGRDIPLLSSRPDAKACRVELPYPAKRIGTYVVVCKVCGLRVGVTTAGRPDDPRSVMLECKEPLQ